MAVYYTDIISGSDSNPGSSGSPWQTIGHALSTASVADSIGVRATGTYVISTGLTMSQSSTNALTKLIGCTTTIGDGGRATIQASAAIVGLTMSGYGCRVENFILDGNATGTTGVSITGLLNNALINCKVENWTTTGLSLNAGANSCLAQGVEVTGCTGTDAVVLAGDAPTLINCAIHDNTAIGIASPSNLPVITLCSVYNNGSHGISTTGLTTTVSETKIYGNSGHGINAPGDVSLLIRSCTIHGNTNDGIHTDTYWLPTAILNNIFTSNGGYGLNASAMSPAMSDDATDYNWFGTGGLANTSGPRNVILAGPHDLSGDPQYVSAGTGDFTPQNAAVQAAYPSGWIGAVTPAGGSGGPTYFAF